MGNRLIEMENRVEWEMGRVFLETRENLVNPYYLLLITYYLLLKSWMGRWGDGESVSGDKGEFSESVLLITYYLNLGWGDGEDWGDGIDR